VTTDRIHLKNFLIYALAVIAATACCSRSDPSEKKPTHESMCWRSVVTDDAPLARLDHAMAVDRAKGLVYLWGGRNGSQFYSDLWVFEARKSEWRRIETDQAPPGRSGHSLVFHPESGRLLLFGGFSFNSSGEVNFHSDLWIYSPDAGWEREFIGSGPAGRAWHAALASQDAMLVFGGFGGPPHYYLQDIWSLDLEELTFRRIATDGGPLMAGSPSLLGMGASTSLLAFGPSVLMVFGRDGVPDPSRTGFWSLQVELDLWSVTETGNSPDDDFTLVVGDAGGKKLLVGRGPEEDDEDREWTFWEYSAGEEEWKEFEVEFGPFTSHRMACASDPATAGGWICFGGARREVVGGETWSLLPFEETERE
jgi:hypothetical protein